MCARPCEKHYIPCVAPVPLAVLAFVECTTLSHLSELWAVPAGAVSMSFQGHGMGIATLSGNKTWGQDPCSWFPHPPALAPLQKPLWSLPCTSVS